MTKQTFLRFGFALLALITLAAAAQAADGSVVGMVLDANGKPIANMSVRATDVVDPSKVYTALTDANGKFVIGNLPSGSYLVSADTVNTSWLQKDDSPIVEVSGGARPDVKLVLIRTGDMSPVGMSPGGKELTTAQLVALGLTSLATVGVIVLIIQHDELEDDNDRLNQELKRLRELIDQRIPASPRN